ncbi:hypothetical protein B0H12DRAFT_1233491 [Mycena haematopus]|nr:hypothetical protein B0H12DRAFT_1233491 [Mycena haematopus]
MPRSIPRASKPPGGPSTRTRPQFTTAQTVLLEHLFHNNTHPSLKNANLEVNAVTRWFQSKRKATSRHRPTRNTTITDSTNTHQHPKSSSSASSRSSSTTSTSTSTSRRPSLDHVASRSELRAPPPRTPSRRYNSHVPLWVNMASSPIPPPSSPFARDYVEFGQGQRMRSLEWACARSRLTAKDQETVPELVHDPWDDTDVEIEEAITPPRSCDSSWTDGKRSKGGEHDEETMKAAMALCDLMNW